MFRSQEHLKNIGHGKQGNVEILWDKFVFNLAVSLAICFIVSIIGFYFTYTHTLVTENRSMGTVAAIVFILIPLILYHMFGSMLKPCGSHIWNYISVSTSFIIMGTLISLEILAFGNAIGQREFVRGFFLHASFGKWYTLLADTFGRGGLYITAILPSLIMWWRLTINAKWQTPKSEDAEK